MSAKSEAALIAIGLHPILEAKPHFNQEQQATAVKLPQTERAMVLRFLSGAEGGGEEFPTFDFDEVSKLLQNVGVEQAHALTTLLPEPFADEVQADATRVVKYLQSARPVQARRSIVAVTLEEPEPFELGRFRRKWMVATDPLVVLRDLIDGTIDSMSVQAFADMYPVTFAGVDGQGGLTGEGGVVDDAIATMKSRRGEKWDISITRDRLLRVLMQAPDTDLDLAGDFAKQAAADAQAAAQPAQPTGPKKSEKQGIDTTAEQLPGQKAA